jgi:hypothetical protein
MGLAAAGRARERYSWARVAADTAGVYQHAAALSEVAA